MEKEKRKDKDKNGCGKLNKVLTRVFLSRGVRLYWLPTAVFVPVNE